MAAGRTRERWSCGIRGGVHRVRRSRFTAATAGGPRQTEVGTMYRRASRRRRSLRSRTCAGQGVLLAAGAAGDLLRAAHRQPMHHLGGVIFDHWHNADERASSPLFAGAEQGNGFVDAALPGVGALGGGDVVDVILLHAVGELAEEDAGLLIGRERGAPFEKAGARARFIASGHHSLARCRSCHTCIEMSK